jgi:hypothetical protein
MNWSSDCKKPKKTTVDQSMMVLVPVSEYLRKEGPVLVPVLSNMDKNWTGPDFQALAVSTHHFLKIFSHLKFNCPPMGQGITTWSDTIKLTMNINRLTGGPWALQDSLVSLTSFIGLNNDLGHKFQEMKRTGHS